MKCMVIPTINVWDVQIVQAYIVIHKLNNCHHTIIIVQTTNEKHFALLPCDIIIIYTLHMLFQLWSVITDIKKILTFCIIYICKS